MKNNSGMHRVAESLVLAERALGIDSHCIDFHTTPDEMVDCDIHVSHTHFTDGMRNKITKPLKLVWVGHGTPDHVFQSAVQEGEKGSYGHGDGLMLLQNNLQTVDAIVTFWPRHAAIYQSLCDKNTEVHCVPLGVDKSFWKPVATRGKFAGSPSLLTCENSHYIKWPYDLFVAWPWVYPKLKLGEAARLHAAMLPRDQHRWFFPLVNRNGASKCSFISHTAFDNENLRNAFCSVDFFIGLVRYGDFNRLSLEANACGAKTISYRGNLMSDYWITEGDQRTMAEELVAILNGVVEPRKKDPVPDISDTAVAMAKIYESVL